MKLISKATILRFVFMIMFIGAIAALFINKGLYYFEDNNHIEVRLEGSTEDINTFMQNFSDDNLTRVERVNHVLYLENTTLESVNSKVQDLNNENKLKVTVTNNFMVRDQLIRNDILINAITIIGSVAIFIYFVLKNKKAISAKQHFYILLSYVELAFFSNLFLAGIISLLSRYYQIREIDLIAFLLMNIWLSVTYFFVIVNIKEENFVNVSSIYASTEFYHKRYLAMAAVVILTASLALGANFVVTAGLIFAAMFIVTFNFVNLGSIANFSLTNLPRPNINLKRPTLPNFRRSRIAETKSVAPVQSKKKKDKSKKKSKNKKNK